MELHDALDGQQYGLGLIDPEPGESLVGAPIGFPVRTLDQIRAELAGKPAQFERRKVFDLSWNLNQARTNACNGHATAGVTARSIYVKTGGRTIVRLSGADAYSQMNGGRDNGSSLIRGMQVVTNGIATEATVPEDDIYCRRNPDAARAERSRFRGRDPIGVDTEEEFATGLLTGLFGVVAVTVDRRGRYESMDSRGVSMGGNGSGNHAVGIDDIRLAPDGVLEYGQFGSWGDHVAYIWLRWNQQLRDCVRNHRFWLLEAAIDDPQGDNPPAVKE